MLNPVVFDHLRARWSLGGTYSPRCGTGFRELGLPFRHVGSRHLQHRLEGYRRIRIPAILSGSEMSDQDMEGPGGANARDFILAGPAMVPVAAGAVVWTGVGSSHGGATFSPTGQQHPLAHRSY